MLICALPSASRMANASLPLVVPGYVAATGEMAEPSNANVMASEPRIGREQRVYGRMVTTPFLSLDEMTRGGDAPRSVLPLLGWTARLRPDAMNAPCGLPSELHAVAGVAQAGDVVAQHPMAGLVGDPDRHSNCPTRRPDRRPAAEYHSCARACHRVKVDDASRSGRHPAAWNEPTSQVATAGDNRTSAVCGGQFHGPDDTCWSAGRCA